MCCFLLNIAYRLFPLTYSYFQASINAHYMIAFSYPILLVIICIVYTVLTRKISETFNESKFIAFSMYTTCRAVIRNFNPRVPHIKGLKILRVPGK